MSERNTSKPWTEEEDQLLRQAVAHYGENDNWKKVAEGIPGRTNKACRKRWLHSLQPNVKKTAWTPDEDKMLVDLHESYGPKWSAIARQIPGRTDDACSKRYREALDPSLKKDQWTHEEDVLLMETYHRIGGKWGKRQRSSRSRWRLLERKKASKANHHMSSRTSPVHTITPHETPVIVEEPLPVAQFQEAPAHVQWPPYYPPEAYPTFPVDGESSGDIVFREPSPEVVQQPDPKVAPFQFSSSSLLTALSDPPRPHAPLPPISAVNTPELVQYDIPNESERQPSLSPLSQCNAIPDMNDILMSLEDYTQGSIAQLPSENSASQITYDIESYNKLPQFTFGDIYTASPFTIPTELSRPEHYNFKPVHIPKLFDSPHSIYGGVLYEETSSASSTPYVLSSSLSPTSSPLPATLLDLPNSEQPSSNSLLFSPADGPRTTSMSAGIRRSRKNTSRKNKPIIKVQVTTRLSSTLPLSSDPNIRPYACGRPQCWPNTATTSSSCFATSGELLDHSKEQHPDEDASEKPYRCALTGCGKSWKSINGLQYHLQISTAHFATALSSRFSAQLPSTPDVNTPSTLEGEIEDLEPERKYMCPQPGCFKAYRQPSGLRYHIKFGHPIDIPTQLAVVPPALERQIPIKAKKLRAKPPPEPVAN
ncbi:Transcription factor MYB3R-4 [Psilocybe cubensis]|uniref:Transcription factor MYB3R-4 n=1 Tax=Psilocybe cubensis TaxID=181762 RepID=A0ACB8HGV3_PSICU|nr:Transcription factor MYB3R-4 [Psilocybe cubensis]KAH9487048.1 Transcription factor MYB3R-4 [Psilocybe cubensis]